MQFSALLSVINSKSTDSLACVKLLVEAGADINTKISGKTPLEHALEKGRMDIVKYLLEQSSND